MHGSALVYSSEQSCVEGRTRSSARGDLVVQRTRTKFGECAFVVAGPSTWNQLPCSIRNSSSVNSFKTALKTFLFAPNNYLTVLYIFIAACTRGGRANLTFEFSFRQKSVKRARAPKSEKSTFPYYHLESGGNYNATSNNMKLVHWPLDGWAVTGTVMRGMGPAQSFPRCTKCNSPPINGQCVYQLHVIRFDTIITRAH